MDKREENTEREIPDVKDEEIQQETGEELPDREAMSLVNANLALPINAAVAANVLSDGSVAYADAQQADTINQGNLASNPLGTQNPTG